VRVPAGTVALGGVYSGVYPRESPGGWHLIGRTETVLFDSTRQPPALLAAGDRVCFIAA
jgi:allophanate hydrolase subunit 1